MAIGHISIRPHSRRQGHTAAAALAYRHAEMLVDSSGQMHDYRHRRRSEHLIDGGVVSPDRWQGGEDLQQLADAIEAAERRKDARLLRDFQIALPHELHEMKQIKLARDFAGRLRDRYDTPVAWALHRPDPTDERSDDRNVHAHIIVPTRTLNEAGDYFGAKLAILDNRKTGPQEVKDVRQLWADSANTVLRDEGISARVDVSRKRSSLPKTRNGLLKHGRCLTENLHAFGLRVGGDMDVGIQLSIKQYFAIAYAHAPLPTWARALLRGTSQRSSSLNLAAALAGLATALKGRSKPDMRASPQYIEIANGKFVWDAANQDRPTNLKPGDTIEGRTKAGRLHTATITSIEIRSTALALARTGPSATVLLRARLAGGRLLEVKREPDWTVSIGDIGTVGSVKNGELKFADTVIGRALARRLGRPTLRLNEFTNQIAKSLAADGAQIVHGDREYSVRTGLNAPVQGLANILQRPTQVLKSTGVHDKQWSATSFLEAIQKHTAAHSAPAARGPNL